MPDLERKFGLILNDGLRPMLKLELPAVALTTPPAAVDWFAGLSVPLGMYGNDQVGDCMVAAIVHDLLVTWCATHPGQKPPRIPTTQDALNFYWSINTDHVDRGLMTQTALEKLLATGIAGYKPLAFATVDLSVGNVRAVTGFFVSAILSVEVDQSQYNGKLWDNVVSPFLGYHGISTGQMSAAPNRVGAASWGYIVELTDAYITHKIQAVDVIIWPWVYNALPSETADKLAADFHALTGRTLPSQVLPTPPAPAAFHWHVQRGASVKTYKLGPAPVGGGPAPIMPGWTTTIWTGPDSSAPCTKPAFRSTMDGKSTATTVTIVSPTSTLNGKVVGVGPPGTSVS
jgi:hypothetical protein